METIPEKLSGALDANMLLARHDYAVALTGIGHNFLKDNNLLPEEEGDFSALVDALGFDGKDLEGLYSDRDAARAKEKSATWWQRGLEIGGGLLGFGGTYVIEYHLKNDGARAIAALMGVYAACEFGKLSGKLSGLENATERREAVEEKIAAHPAIETVVTAFVRNKPELLLQNNVLEDAAEVALSNKDVRASDFAQPRKPQMVIMEHETGLTTDTQADDSSIDVIIPDPDQAPVKTYDLLVMAQGMLQPLLTGKSTPVLSHIPM